MSSKNAAKVKKVKIKVLEIQELGNAKQESPIVVSLGVGPLIGHVDETPIYKGEMKYYDGDKYRQIDMTEAVFSSKKGNAGAVGNISLEVELTNSNEFKAPLVTTVPLNSSSVPTHCLTIKGAGKSTITVTFLEPQEGEFVSYPSLYFHTTAGIIDPGMSITRKPN